MSEPSFDPVAGRERWKDLNATIDALLALGESTLRAARPEVSAWSPLHHLAHLSLANELILRNLQSLAARSGLLIQTGKAPNERAIAMLAEGRLPRGQAKSPRMVVPPADVELEFVKGWHADNRRALAAIEPSSIVASELTIPHQLLGPLNAPQWMRFAVVHTEHHLGIAVESLGDATPKALRVGR